MEEQGVILLRTLDKPLHVLDNVRLVRFEEGVRSLVSKNNDVRIVIAKAVWYQLTKQPGLAGGEYRYALTGSLVVVADQRGEERTNKTTQEDNIREEQDEAMVCQRPGLPMMNFCMFLASLIHPLKALSVPK